MGFPEPATRVISALRAQKLQTESENEFPGALGPGAQKVQTGVEKESISRIVDFDSFLDSVLDLFGPWNREAQEPIFRLYLQLRARRAQMTPVARKSFR